MTRVAKKSSATFRNGCHVEGADLPCFFQSGIIQESSAIVVIDESPQPEVAADGASLAPVSVSVEGRARFDRKRMRLSCLEVARRFSVGGVNYG